MTEEQTPDFSRYEAIHKANERYEELPNDLTKKVNKTIEGHFDGSEWRKSKDLADKIYDTTREFVLDSVGLKSGDVSAGFLENTITQILGKTKSDLEYELAQKAKQYKPEVAEDASDEVKEKAEKEAKKKYKRFAEGEIRQLGQRAEGFYKQDIAGRLSTLTTDDISGFQGFLVEELEKAGRSKAAKKLKESKFSRVSTLTSMYEDKLALALRYSKIINELELDIETQINEEAD